MRRLNLQLRSHCFQNKKATADCFEDQGERFYTGEFEAGMSLTTSNKYEETLN